MTEDVAWELRLELSDGVETFAALMRTAGVPAISRGVEPGCYGWRLGPDGRTATILLGHDGQSEASVCWAGDWATAERRLEAIEPGLSGRLLAVGQPVNLVSFGACAGDLAARATPPLARPSAGKPRPGRTAKCSVETAADAVRCQAASDPPDALKRALP